ncbi:hypothetical protein SAMN02746062_00030 [Alysiella filiformis DSM 16848]|uniref:Uncharacterized protein n=2 Tax=Alysiella TaxID=194195 RepID=A0A286E1L6_9NEIS|nr:hypothetical protein [Alysiella filiformis]SOD64779.1 hypothetical protein SAMN02746062_00030 [Alysiella filiformis DSM 16848]
MAIRLRTSLKSNGSGYGIVKDGEHYFTLHAKGEIDKIQRIQQEYMATPHFSDMKYMLGQEMEKLLSNNPVNIYDISACDEMGMPLWSANLYAFNQEDAINNVYDLSVLMKREYPNYGRNISFFNFQNLKTGQSFTLNY